MTIIFKPFPYPVASLSWLVSLGAVTDGVILFTSKRHDVFIVIVLQTTTTRTLSAFPGDRLSSVLVNSSAKKYLDFH